MNENGSPADLAGMMQTIERSLVNEFARLTNEALFDSSLGAANHPRYVIDFDDLAAVIGPRWAYLTLRRCKFEPADHGPWARRPHGPGPLELVEVDLSTLTRRYRWAAYTLDPLRVCEAYYGEGLA